MPPGHGKSTMVSWALPCWWLGNFPRDRVVLAGYNDTFAGEWGKKARDTVNLHGPSVFGIRVSDASAARNRWDLVSVNGSPLRGGLIAVGIGGGLTGHRSNLMVVDDPIKTPEEAASQTSREQKWEWWRRVASTRWEPDSAVVLVMTRWHEDDLAGRILENEPDDWTVLSLPALAEDDDALGRPVGAALWPERFPVHELEKTRKDVGSQVFVSMYQQRPVPAEGALFKREHMLYWTPLSDGYALQRADGTTRVVGASQGWKLQTVDMAVTTKSSSDYTVVSTFLVTPGNDIVVLDVARQRLEGPDVAKFVEAQFRRQRPNLPDLISVESVQFQLSVLQSLRRSGLPAVQAVLKGDKYGRALSFAARMEAGTVYFPRNAPWMEAVEQELFTFPHGRHDDIIDTFSIAAHEVIERGEQDWSQAYGIQHCPCGQVWSTMSTGPGIPAQTQCPACGKPPEEPLLTVLEGTAEPAESWYPEPSKPSPLEALAELRSLAGRRF